MFRFDNASDIILRNLTIQATGTTFTRAINMQNRADNILVEDCVIESPTPTAATTELNVVDIRPSISSDIQLRNNTVIGGAFGILCIS